METTRIETDNITTKTTSGLVEKIQEATLEYKAAITTVNNKRIIGTRLYIRTDNNSIDKIDFPRRFSLPERDVIINQTIQYTKISQGPQIGSSIYKKTWQYRLELLTGKYKGWTLEKKIDV